MAMQAVPSLHPELMPSSNRRSERHGLAGSELHYLQRTPRGRNQWYRTIRRRNCRYRREMTVEYFLVSRQKLHAKGSSSRSQPEGIGVRPGLLAGCTESLEVDHPIWPREHVEFAAISDTPLNRSEFDQGATFPYPWGSYHSYFPRPSVSPEI
jgi:hypothetical protein